MAENDAQILSQEMAHEECEEESEEVSDEENEEQVKVGKTVMADLNMEMEIQRKENKNQNEERNLGLKEIFEKRVVMAVKDAQIFSKEICYFGSCQTKNAKHWLCKCCNLCFCYNHSFEERHLDLTVKQIGQCGVCRNDAKIYPAVSTINNTPACFQCIQQSKQKGLKKLPNDSCLLLILKKIEVFAYKRVAKSINYLLGQIYGRWFHINLLAFEWEIKVHYFLSIFEYHSSISNSESYRNDVEMLNYLQKISNCLLGSEDLPLVEAVRKKVHQSKLISAATKRRRVVFTSDL